MDKSGRILDIKKTLGLLLLGVLTVSCCWFDPDECEECFEKANLFFPGTITNTLVATTAEPTFVGFEYFPTGTQVGVANGIFAFNEFFSVRRFVPEIGTEAIFFWNRDTPTPLGQILEGETVTYYKLVANLRADNSLECAFAEAREVKSVLDVRVRAEDGQIVGERTVERTVFEIPSGGTAIFNFQFVFFQCGTYEFDIVIDPEGQLSETSVVDNGFSEVHPNFGVCF
ncbi:hypothetical protein [Gilvibacter sp.]|uniref:hypothetical protein n=1 Tax=Gilvibacter sp. TaxID=2729997 RepID=UPI003F4A71FA